MKRNTKKIVLLVAATVTLSALICLTIYLKSMSDYKQAVNNITFQNIDITTIADGTYIGECDYNVSHPCYYQQ